MSTARDLQEQAARLPYGTEKVSLLQRAAEEAALAADLDHEFTVRGELVSAANYSEQPQLGLVHVTWCLEHLDRHPGRFDPHWTLWQLKWAPMLLVDYPETSLQSLDELLEQVAQRHTAHGDSGNAVAKLRWLLAMQTGRLLEARDLLAAWQLHSRTPLSDCRLCDVAEEARLRLQAGDETLAILTAAPMIDGPRSCSDEPALLLPELLPALEKAADPRTAAVFSRAADLVGSTEGLLMGAAQLARWAAHVGEERSARRWGARAVTWGGRTRVPFRRMSALAAQAVTEDFLQEPLPGRMTDRPDQEARTLATAFDTRNGNRHISNMVDGWLRLGSASPAPAVADLPAVRPERTPHPPTATPAPDDADSRLAALTALNPHDRIAGALSLEQHARHHERPAVAALARRHRASALAMLGRTDEARDLLGDLPELLAERNPFEAVLAHLGLASLTSGQDADAHLAQARLLRDSLPDHTRQEAEAEIAFCALPQEAPASQFEAIVAMFHGRPERQAVVRVTQALALLRDGDLTEAERAVETALGLAADGTAHLQARILSVKVSVLECVDPPRAAVVARDAIRLGRESGDLILAGSLAAGRARLQDWLGDPAAALACHFEAVECFGSSGDRVAHGWARLELAHCLRGVERHDEAYEVWDQLLTTYPDLTELVTAVHLSMGQCDADFGYADQASLHVEQGLNAAAENSGNRGRLLVLQARIAASTDDVEAAASSTDEAVAVLLAAGQPDAAAAALRAHVGHLIEAGRPEDALGRFDQVEDLEGREESPSLERVQLLVALGDTVQARALADTLPRTTAQEAWDAARAAVALRDQAAATSLFDQAVDLASTSGSDAAELECLRMEASQMLSSIKDSDASPAPPSA